MIRRAAILALLAFVAPAPAWADAAGEAMLRDFVKSIDALGDKNAAAGSIRSDGSDTVMEGLTITGTAPDITLKIDSVRFGDLSEHPDGGGFSADTIEMTGLSVDGSVFHLRMPSASVSDVSFPSFADASIDMAKLMTSIVHIYSIAARGAVADLSVPEVTFDVEAAGMPDTSEPLKMHIVYHDLHLTGFSNGVIEKQEIGPAEISETLPSSGGDIHFNIGGVAMQRFDVGGFVRIFDESQYADGRGDGVWHPILESLTYGGYSGTGPDGLTFSMKGAAIENLDGRQPEKPFTRDLDRLLDPSVSQDDKSDVALETVLGMYSAWRLGAFHLDAITFEMPSEQASFALGGMKLSGLSTDGFDNFSINNMSVKSPQGFGSMETFEIAGFKFPDVQALMRFAALEKEAPTKKHDDTIRATFAALPRLAHLGISGVRGGLSESLAVSLGSFTIDLADWNDIFAQAVDIRAIDIEVPRSFAYFDPKSAEIMDQLGYDRLIYGMSLSDRWSADAGSDDATWSLSMQDAADIELKYSLTGLTTDWILRATAVAGKATDSATALQAMYSELGLKGATLKVTDRSLLDRGFGIAAKMQNLTVSGAAYREQLRGALPFLLSAAVPQDLTKLLSEPLQGFMAGGQTLVAEIAPPAPIPLPEIVSAAEGDPMTIPSRLGITLRSEAPQ